MIRWLRGAFAVTLLTVVVVALVLLRERPGVAGSPVATNPCVGSPMANRSPTPTPGGRPAAPGTPDLSGLAPRPLRTVNLSPGVPRRDESEISVQRPDCAREASFVDPANADAFVKQLLSGDRVLAIAAPRSVMEQQVVPAPSVTPGTRRKPTPPGWNPSPSSTGLTLSVQPEHGGLGSGVRITGSVAPNLMPPTPIDVEFWPGGPHQSLGDRAQTKYTGPVWPSRWPVRPGKDGRFTLDIVKVPRVIQTASGDLWLIEPGPHDFALVLDTPHATFAPFQVDAPLPLPTTLPPPTVQFQRLWLADALTGWLTGARCQGVIDATTDGGKTWLSESLGDPRLIPRAIQFVDARHGWLAATTLSTCDQTCATVIFRTTDGGATWHSLSFPISQTRSTWRNR